MNINGTLLDLGGNDFSHNITKHFKGSYNIQFADKFPKNEQVIKVDLEKDETVKKTFENVCIMNVLEHIKNYRNAINLCKKSLSKNGFLIGTVPFIFKVHYSPNDYFRFTEQLLEEELNSLITQHDSLSKLNPSELGNEGFEKLFQLKDEIDELRLLFHPLLF